MSCVAQVQSALDNFVRNVSNPRKAKHMLQEIGTHHFFYDAYEPHLQARANGVGKNAQERHYASNK